MPGGTAAPITPTTSGTGRTPASGFLTVVVFGASLALLSLLSQARAPEPGTAQATPTTSGAPTVLSLATLPPTVAAPATATVNVPATSTAEATFARAEATGLARETVVAQALAAQAEATTEVRVTQAATTVARYTAEAQARSDAALQAAAAATVQAEEAEAAYAAALSATAQAEAEANAAAPAPEAVAQAEPVPATAPEPVAEPAPAAHPAVPRLVLASYLAWYDGDGWDDCNISAGDKPAEPYASDDPAAIGRHVQQALGAGIDGFLLHWFAPGERTDANLAQLLAQSGGTGFQSSVVFLRHLWHGSPGPSQDSLAESLSYLIGTYGGHPNFLRLEGKPVIFFADMQRVPGGSPVEAWRAIRDRVDPDRQTWWIAEGLDPSYLSVFDGLYVYKITHATDPGCYAKAGRWAEWVRSAEQTYGCPKLWVGTISPGYDDTRAGCKSDARVPSAAQRRERDSGTFYRATYDAAAASGPDWLLVQSFNEWVEGTYVEPSAQYGDLYLQLTREFAAAFK